MGASARSVQRRSALVLTHPSDVQVDLVTADELAVVKGKARRRPMDTPAGTAPAVADAPAESAATAAVSPPEESAPSAPVQPETPVQP